MENESLNLNLSLEYMFNIKISITNMMKKIHIYKFLGFIEEKQLLRERNDGRLIRIQCCVNATSGTVNDNSHNDF